MITRDTTLFGKAYHWAYNRKGNITLHRGESNKCRRVHPEKGLTRL